MDIQNAPTLIKIIESATGSLTLALIIFVILSFGFFYWMYMNFLAKNKKHRRYIVWYSNISAIIMALNGAFVLFS